MVVDRYNGVDRICHETVHCECIPWEGRASGYAGSVPRAISAINVQYHFLFHAFCTRSHGFEDGDTLYIDVGSTIRNISIYEWQLIGCLQDYSI